MCYENAVAINPTHVRSLQHLVSYTLLRVNNEKKILRREPTPWFLQINPASCIYFQGMVLHQLGNNHLAEKVLRDAVNAEPTSSVSW